jgi:receptor-type tyrosine-protein phosphatase delta
MQSDLPISLWTVHPVDSVQQLTSLGNLHTNRTYSLRVLAFTSAGDGPLSDAITVKTSSNAGQSLSRYYRIRPFFAAPSVGYPDV